MVKEISQYKNNHGKIGHSIDEDHWMRIVEKQLEDYKKSIKYE